MPQVRLSFILPAPQRIKMLTDEGSFSEYDADMVSNDPLDFKGPKTYKEKLTQDQAATGLKDAVITGKCRLNGKRRSSQLPTRALLWELWALSWEKKLRAQ